jgi:methylmalonyl-CoA/ethylmalonyl-CoA epimerase
MPVPQHAEIQISQIGQVAIPVQDLDRAVAFYRDVLHLPFLFQAPGLAFFQCGEVRLMLALPEGNDAPVKAAVVYYKVADLDRAYAALGAHNAKRIGEPHLIAKMPDHDLWMTFCEDSEGNMVGLMSEVRNG